MLCLHLARRSYRVVEGEMGKALVPSHELKVSILSKRLSTVVELHPASFLLSCVAERISTRARIGGPPRFVVGATKKRHAPKREDFGYI